MFQRNAATLMGAAFKLEPGCTVRKKLHEPRELPIERGAPVTDLTRLLNRMKARTLALTLCQTKARLTRIERQLGQSVRSLVSALRLSRNPSVKTSNQPLHLTVRANRQCTVGAGWSSPVARQAHNLKVAGSNPAPATNDPCDSRLSKASASERKSGFFFPAAKRRMAPRSPRSTMASSPSSGIRVT